MFPLPEEKTVTGVVDIVQCSVFTPTCDVIKLFSTTKQQQELEKSRNLLSGRETVFCPLVSVTYLTMTIISISTVFMQSVC